MARQVFEGVKVGEFGWVLVGPFHGLYLAHHGATVIHVESSHRLDINRTMPPYKDGEPGINRSVYYEQAESGKYGITLNLNHPQGVEVAKQIVAWADVVIENFTPGVMKRWGLDYESIKKIKPDIIMLSSCNQGQTGPDATQPGYGPDLTSLSGFTHLAGWQDRDPVQIYGAYTDYIAPKFGVTALIAALDYRRRTGKGLYLDLSQYECGLQFLAPVILDYTVNHRQACRMGNYCPYASPHGAYRCQGEDRWCAIAAFSDEEWQSFCQVIGNPAWTRDPRFATRLGRVKASEELDKLVEEWTIHHSAEEVMSLMQKAGVAAGVVATSQDLYQDPQFKHRHYLVELEHPEMGKYLCDSPFGGLSKTPGQPRMSSPCLGQHNEYVYKELLGGCDEEYTKLLSAGVFD